MKKSGIGDFFCRISDTKKAFPKTDDCRYFRKCLMGVSFAKEVFKESLRKGCLSENVRLLFFEFLVKNDKKSVF